MGAKWLILRRWLWGLIVVVGAAVLAFAGILALGLLWGNAFYSGTDASVVAYPSEAEAKAHFLRHEAQYEELQSIYRAHDEGAIVADTALPLGWIRSKH